MPGPSGRSWTRGKVVQVPARGSAGHAGCKVVFLDGCAYPPFPWTALIARRHEPPTASGVCRQTTAHRWFLAATYALTRSMSTPALTITALIAV
jgi:hypothetical protein